MDLDWTNNHHGYSSGLHPVEVAAEFWYGWLFDCGFYGKKPRALSYLGESNWGLYARYWGLHTVESLQQGWRWAMGNMPCTWVWTIWRWPFYSIQSASCLGFSLSLFPRSLWPPCWPGSWIPSHYIRLYCGWWLEPQPSCPLSAFWSCLQCAIRQRHCGGPDLWQQAPSARVQRCLLTMLFSLEVDLFLFKYLHLSELTRTSSYLRCCWSISGHLSNHSLVETTNVSTKENCAMFCFRAWFNASRYLSNSFHTAHKLTEVAIKCFCDGDYQVYSAAWTRR